MEQNICPYLKRYGRFAVAGILALVSCNGYAQTLDLYDAVTKSISNYPLIQQRQAEVAASRAHLTTVNSNRLPSLLVHDQVTAGTANSLAGSYFPLGIVPSSSGGVSAENKSAASSGNIAISFLQWEFYNFGYYNARKKEAQAQLATSRANMGSDTYLLTESVIGLYLDWLKKYRLLQIETENVQRAETILNAIRATVISGLKPGVDSMTASATYAEARISYLQAQDDYNNDKIALTSYTAADNSIHPDTAIISNAFQSKLFAFQPSDSISITHPLLNVYEKQYEQQVATNNAVAKRYLPRLNIDGAAWMRGSSISPTGEYESDLSQGLPYSRYNYLFGLTLTYNLFDLKHRHDQLVEGKYVAQARQSALQNEQLDLDRLLLQANSAYATTYEKLKLLPIQQRSALQAYQQQMALYRAGLNTLIDVSNAQYVLRQTETSNVLAQDQLLQLLFIRAGLSNQLDLFLQNFKH